MIKTRIIFSGIGKCPVRERINNFVWVTSLSFQQISPLYGPRTDWNEVVCIVYCVPKFRKILCRPVGDLEVTFDTVCDSAVFQKLIKYWNHT